MAMSRLGGCFWTVRHRWARKHLHFNQIEYNFMFVKVFIKPLKRGQFSNVENYRKLFRYKKLVCSLFLLIHLVSKRS